MSTTTLEPSRSREVAQRDPRTNGLLLVAAMAWFKLRDALW